jgi:hypothetical protein
MKYKKTIIDEILSSMNYLDMGCCYIGEGRFKKDCEIVLDNDEDGNARFGQFILKVTKVGVKIQSGDRLTKKEKRLNWKFEDYGDVDSLVDDIYEFSRKYFSSFETCRYVDGELKRPKS